MFPVGRLVLGMESQCISLSDRSGGIPLNMSSSPIQLSTKWIPNTRGKIYCDGWNEVMYLIKASP